MKYLLFAVLVWTGVAAAQPYPVKPVRWIVPTGAGSAVDVTARRIAPKLADALGAPRNSQPTSAPRSRNGAR
jgi:tripartite-type tricarboxylate transporter receptor subunit TctC